MNQDMAALFGTLTHGVYVIGVAAGERRNAFTAAWLMQVSFNPPLLALSINPSHSSYALLKKGGGFTVNVLASDQMEMAAHFGQPASVDKLANRQWHPSPKGAPIFSDGVAWFECEWLSECQAGDHTIVIGRVTNGARRDGAATPLNYRDTGSMDGSAALYPDEFPPT